MCRQYISLSCVGIFIPLISVAIALMFLLPLPNSYVLEQEFLLSTYHNFVQPECNSKRTVSVVSFNIRLDGEESNPDNHFTKRVHRLGSFFTSLRPTLVGLQETLGGQLLHIQSIPKEYAAIGFEGNGHDKIDRGNRIRMHDYQTAILYDQSELSVVADDHIWLSKTPRVQHSKSWDSESSRTLTIGAFHLKNSKQSQYCQKEISVNSSNSTSVDILMFNMHLDVKGEVARRKQAARVRLTISEWRQRYPQAIVFLTGDFNTAASHPPHRILLQPFNQSFTDDRLHDAWDECSAHASTAIDPSYHDRQCISHSFSPSFHGFVGPTMNSYAGRFVHYVAQTVHGCGIQIPRHIPNSFHELLSAVNSIGKNLWSSKHLLLSAMPRSINRLHVDWILYAQPLHSISAANANSNVIDTEKTEKNVKLPAGSVDKLIIRPRLVFVGEIRAANFSSDHFPIVSVFAVEKLRA